MTVFILLVLLILTSLITFLTLELITVDALANFFCMNSLEGKNSIFTLKFNKSFAKTLLHFLQFFDTEMFFF